MNWLLKIIASQSLKMGIAFALETIGAVVAALRGVLDYGQVSDDVRRKIGVVLAALTTVRDFLVKVSVLIGAPVGVVPATLEVDRKLEEAMSRLRQVTDSL